MMLPDHEGPFPSREGFLETAACTLRPCRLGWPIPRHSPGLRVRVADVAGGMPVALLGALGVPAARDLRGHAGTTSCAFE